MATMLSRRSCLRYAGALALAAVCLAPAWADDAAPAPADTETPVEALLFDTDHLAGVKPPVRLEYSFSWDGQNPFADRIVLAITADKGKMVEPDYLSDGHHVNFPSIPDAHGNPLLLYFLEDDLREMQRETQGQRDYFRRVIRRAMAAPGIAVEPVEVQVAGRTVKAQRIVIAPFHADPTAPARYPRLVEKTYEFVFSPEVPGQIVSLATHVTPADGKTQTVRVEWAKLSPM